MYTYTIHWTNNFVQGTKKTRSCLTGHPVVEVMRYNMKDIEKSYLVVLYVYCLQKEKSIVSRQEEKKCSATSMKYLQLLQYMYKHI